MEAQSCQRVGASPWKKSFTLHCDSMIMGSGPACGNMWWSLITSCSSWKTREHRSGWGVAGRAVTAGDLALPASIVSSAPSRDSRSIGSPEDDGEGLENAL